MADHYCGARFSDCRVFFNKITPSFIDFIGDDFAALFSGIGVLS